MKIKLLCTGGYKGFTRDLESDPIMVDADFLPDLSKKGIAPGDWPFSEDEVEVL